MTNYNNTDKIIREKYDSIGSELDLETMWTELSPLVENKKRRGFLFWMFVGIVVVSVSALSYVTLQNSDENNLNLEEVNDSNNEVESPSSVALVNESYTKTIDFQEEEVVMDLESAQSVVVSPMLDEGNAIVKGSEHNYNYSFSISNVEVNESGDNADLLDEITLGEFVEFPLHNALEVEELSEFYSRVELTSLDGLAGIDYSPLLFSRSLIDGSFLEMVDDATRPLMKRKLRIGLNGGFYTHSRSFENVGDEILQNFKSRSTEEKAKDAYDLGIKLEYFVSNNFVIVGGLRFSQSFVQRNADYAYVESITLKDHVVTIINTEEGVVEVLADVTYDGVVHHKADNYITATRLGLITGMQYRVGTDRWSTHVDLGVELPVWSSHSGVITNNGKPYNLSDDTEDINTSSLQMFGGIGVEYSLSSSTALQATIGGYMPLNNEHVEAYAIEKKSTVLGLNLGVHFRL